MPVIGFLGSESPAVPMGERRARAFRQGPDAKPAMSRAGTWRSNTAGRKAQNDRLPALAADLARRQASLIAIGWQPCGTAVKAATTTIPIVFVGRPRPGRGSDWSPA